MGGPPTAAAATAGQGWSISKCSHPTIEQGLAHPALQLPCIVANSRIEPWIEGDADRDKLTAGSAVGGAGREPRLHLRDGVVRVDARGTEACAAKSKGGAAVTFPDVPGVGHAVRDPPGGDEIARPARGQAWE